MELDVIVHKKYFPCITVLNFGYSASPANLVVEVGTRHSHQILLANIASGDKPLPDPMLTRFADAYMRH